MPFVQKKIFEYLLLNNKLNLDNKIQTQNEKLYENCFYRHLCFENVKQILKDFLYYLQTGSQKDQNNL